MGPQYQGVEQQLGWQILDNDIINYYPDPECGIIQIQILDWDDERLDSVHVTYKTHHISRIRSKLPRSMIETISLHEDKMGNINYFFGLGSDLETLGYEIGLLKKASDILERAEAPGEILSKVNKAIGMLRDKEPLRAYLEGQAESHEKVARLYREAMDNL